MENKKELIQEIEKQISVLEQYISSFSFENEEKISKNKKIIENNMDQTEFDFLKELNLNELLSILPESFGNDLINLEFYIKSLNTTKYGNIMMKKPEVATHIREILSKIVKYLMMIEEKNNNDKKDVVSYQNKKVELSSLKEKITDEKTLDENDIDGIFEVVDSISDKNKAIDLLISFGEKLLNREQSYSSTEEEVEELIENENKEEVEQNLKNIFAKYNLNFYSLNPKDQTLLINYGKCDTVDEILKIIKENNIDLNEKYNMNETIIELKSLVITEILLHGDIESIKKIFELAQKSQLFTEDEFRKNNIILLLRNPACFMKRKRRHYRRGETTISSKAKPKETIRGLADDFIANFKLLISLGAEPEELLKKEYPLEGPHSQILNHKKIYELYGIDKRYYLRSPSCLHFNSQPADVIDQYIEIGFFNYFKDNMTIVNLGTDDLNCYKLLYAIKYTNLDPKNFFKTRNEKKLGPKLVINNLYLDSNEVIQNMTKNNCYKFVGKYIPLSEKTNTKSLYEKFNDAIARSDNAETNIALTRKDSIIPLLDEYFLVKDEKNLPVFPNVYKFGTVAINTASGEFVKEWDIIISRNKVLRIYNTLMQQGITDNNNIESIIYSITRNSILTEVEYNIIYEAVINLMKKVKGLR